MEDNGKNPIQCDAQPLPSTKTYKQRLRHIGNAILVSSQQYDKGFRQSGWKLEPPLDSAIPKFLDWLKNNWRGLYEGSEDLDYLLLEEVVKEPDGDDRMDSRNGLLLHKFHMLWIIAFHWELDIIKRKELG